MSNEPVVNGRFLSNIELYKTRADQERLAQADALIEELFDELITDNLTVNSAGKTWCEMCHKWDEHSAGCLFTRVNAYLASREQRKEGKG